MNEEYTIKPIAHIQTDFPDKFGVPRQSGIINELVSKIVFEPQYRDVNAVRGLEAYSHLWLIWKFSKVESDQWSPTVRPPKLGGNKRVGVFASRSPFRPNKLGLSSVKIEKIEIDKAEGAVIYVSGADLVDGTPIYDIKPYLPYTDSHSEAESGFSKDAKQALVNVEFARDFENEISREILEKIKAVLSQDPHPSYKRDENRVYKMLFSEYEVYFKLSANEILVTEIKNHK